MFVFDRGELVFRVVDKLDAGAGLAARGEAVHAAVFEGHVVVAIGGAGDVAFAVVGESALIAIGFAGRNHSPERIALQLTRVAVRVDGGERAAQSVVAPPAHRLIGRGERREVLSRVVAESRVLTEWIGHCRELRAFPVELRAFIERVGATDQARLLIVTPAPLSTDGIDGLRELIALVVFERDLGAVGGDGFDQVAACVVDARRFGAGRVDLFGLLSGGVCVLVLRLSAIRVHDRHDLAEVVHLIQRDVTE